MAKYTKRPVTIEAITFDELIALGKLQGGAIVNGMPWSFTYCGHPITHENDDCYLIPTLEGTMKFQRGDMLITGVKGEIYPIKAEIFAATYESGEGRKYLTECECGQALLQTWRYCYMCGRKQDAERRQ